MTSYHWGIFFLIILIKACLSASEIAFKSKHIQRQLKELSEDENDENNSVFDIDKYVITINILKSVSVMFFGAMLFQYIYRFIEYLNNSYGNVYLRNFAAAIVIFILMLCLLVIFGSFIPKKLAAKYPEKTIKYFKFPIDFIYFVFYIFFKPLNIISKKISMLLGIDNFIYANDVTQEEIMMMIDAGGETGSIDDDEREMINNVFEFDDKTAGDIATHRKDIVSLSIDSDIEDIVKIVIDEKYSRIPVYKESIDDIIGILHIKDVMKHLIMFGKKDFDIKELLMEPYFVPFTKKTDELFKEMQDNKIHLSIVLDEYGGTLGIVSMEDLIEEIMGNILDEYDNEEEPAIYTDDGINYYIDGTTSVEDVSDYLNIQIDNEEYDTMSGFIIGKMGRIPKDGDNFEFKYSGFVFKIQKTEENRISLVKAVKILSEEEDFKNTDEA